MLWVNLELASETCRLCDLKKKKRDMDYCGIVLLVVLYINDESAGGGVNVIK